MKRFFNKVIQLKISSKLILFFAILLLAPSLTIGLFSYGEAKSSVEEQLQLNAYENVKMINNAIDDEIGSRVYDMNYFSDIVNEEMLKDEQSTGKIISQYSNLHPKVLTIYVGVNDGRFIQSPRQQVPSDYDPRVRPWYKQAMENNGEVIITEPYTTATGDEGLVVTVAKALSDGSGVVAIDFSLNYFNELIKDIKVGKEGYLFISDNSQSYIAHPSEKLGEKIPESANSMYTKDEGDFSYEFKGESKKLYFTTNKITGWKIAGTMYDNEVEKAVSSVYKTLIIVILISLVIGAVVATPVIRSITKPLKNLQEKALTISQGNLTERIEVKRNDEIGSLALSFNQMVDSLKFLIGQVSSTSESVAASAEELSASSEQTSAATEQIATSITDTATNSEKQFESILNSKNSITEISSGMDQVSNNVQSVTDFSLQTVTQAQDGYKNVNSSIEQMHKVEQSTNRIVGAVNTLEEKSKEIDSIVAVITDIANETKLLALNANIEAARAGEHGRGFAVVANEVKKLSEQSKTAADNVKNLVKEVQKETSVTVEYTNEGKKAVDEGLALVNVAGESFKEILGLVDKISEQMQDVAASIQQITASSDGIKNDMDKLINLSKTTTQHTQNIAASSEEQSASMEEITASANTLAKMAEELQNHLRAFKI